MVGVGLGVRASGAMKRSRGTRAMACEHPLIGDPAPQELIVNHRIAGGGKLRVEAVAHAVHPGHLVGNRRGQLCRESGEAIELPARQKLQQIPVRQIEPERRHRYEPMVNGVDVGPWRICRRLRRPADPVVGVAAWVGAVLDLVEVDPLTEARPAERPRIRRRSDPAGGLIVRDPAR